ncbi:MAG TPA: Rieske 2Fe-2S domain-containing protein [Trueperaceae bacterium]
MARLRTDRAGVAVRVPTERGEGMGQRLRSRSERLLERTGRTGLGVGRSLHEQVLAGGEATRNAADLLHGTWLGHPLHPVLTDLTIGAWTFGAIFDGIGAITGDRATQRTADQLTAIGTASALPTALAGITDYSTLPKGSASTGTSHALLNAASLVFYGLSLLDRRRGRRGRGLMLAAAGLAANTYSAWLGGHLVYRERVGVDHSERFSGPREWTDVLGAQELPVGRAKRVEYEGKAIMLYRDADEVYAIGAVCSHAGGPLEEGAVRGCYVECPWHQSVFDLRDGSIRHGPATACQPAFDARLREGRVEVRLAEKQRRES